MAEDITLAVLEELEMAALKALVRQAGEGNVAAASAALQVTERIRKTRLATLHERALTEHAANPVGLVAYLSGLGQSVEQIETRLKRKMIKVEQAAFARALEDRLLEVRAVEIGRMRRGEGDVPRWAVKKVNG